MTFILKPSYYFPDLLRAAVAGVSIFLLCMGCGRNENRARQPISWKEFSSRSGNFSVLLPGSPKEKTVTEPSTSGEIELHSFIVETEDGAAYGVLYNDYPATAVLPQTETAFDGSESAVINQHKGKVIDQKSLKFGNRPAREFEFQAGGKANYSGRVRLIFVDRRLYQLVTIFLTENPQRANREKFFDSFSFLQN